MKAMQTPIKENVIADIIQNVPSSLLASPIWLAYYFKENADGTYSKPPCFSKGYSVDSNIPGVTFEEAIKDGFPGIKITPNHGIIAFDIDDKEAKLGKRKFSIDNLSQEFKAFIKKHNPYVEISPSQCGLRLLFTCKDKTGLPGRTSLIPELCIGGELYIQSGYVTITGDKVCGFNLPEINADELKKWYAVKTADVIPIKPTQVPVPNILNFPSLGLFKEALQVCTLNQDDRVKKAYKTIINTPYSHYDYWMRIMSACHNYALVSGQSAEVLSRVVEWCKTDKLSYQSEDDVLAHWKSLGDKPNQVTYSTLFKFASLLQFKWPEEAYDKNGNATGKPLVNSYRNICYLLNHYSIEFVQDVFDGELYVTGDDDVLDRFFHTAKSKTTFFGMRGPFTEDAIKGCLWALAQSKQYTNVTYSTIAPLAKKFLQEYTKEVNMLKLWLDTEPEDLSEDMQEQDTDLSCSNMEYLMSCVKFNKSQNMELVHKYFETFFFEMMMPLYNPQRKYSQRSFMLVLVGPEACRKTTFFTMLFPAKLRRQFVTNSTETLSGAKSIRDFSTSLVTSVLVVTDEFEIFYNPKNDSLFKTYVTSDVIDYVPIYEKTMKKAPRNAVLAGTTNKTSMQFEQDSNRRLAMIEVSFIDTTAMEKINWHHFYRDFIKRGKEFLAQGIHPWKLQQETINLQYQENEQFRSLTNLEIVLKEVFDFEMHTHKEPYDYNKITSVQTDPNIFKLNDIAGIIKQRYPDSHFTPAELRHVLKRYCGKYTHTTNKTMKLGRSNGSISNGIVKQTQYTRYLMPPILTDF